MRTTDEPAPAGAERRAVLEEERDFFLRSLRDLEAERAAGDIDEVDYRTLTDDYTRRAAEVLRRLEGSHDTDPEDGPGPGPDVQPDEAGEERGPVTARHRLPLWRRSRARTGVAVVAVVAVGAVAGWKVGSSRSHTVKAMSAAQVEQLLIDGQSIAANNPVAALKDFRQILATYPDQPQALTDEGWLLAQGGVVAQGEAALKRAEAVAPSYDLPHAYLGYLMGDQRDFTGAIAQLTFYLSHGPDPVLTSEAKAALAAARSDAAKQTKAGTAKAGTTKAGTTTAGGG